MTRTTRTTPIASPLYARIRQILESARASAARSVNTTQVLAYWLIGREIVEEEQKGKRRAGYGEELLTGLSARLNAEFGSGYSVHTLKFIRQFYVEYPRLGIGHALRSELATTKIPPEIHYAPPQISDALPQKSVPTDPGDTLPPIRHVVRSQSWAPGRLHPNLSWTHYRTLLRVDKPGARAFYEIEAIKHDWSARELERQINSLLYERLAWYTWGDAGARDLAAINARSPALPRRAFSGEL
jgi:hypothetical protein